MLIYCEKVSSCLELLSIFYGRSKLGMAVLGYLEKGWKVSIDKMSTKVGKYLCLK